MEELLFNEYQSSLEELKIDSYPQEIQEQFFDFINNVPFIKHLVSPTRLKAKDLPRDEEGKIIVDITKPHILEDMDYFRQTAIHFQKYGCFTKLRPNPNPNSEYGKWIREELRRCFDGYVRESDGEWITGDLYFFLNYCPIPLTKMKKGSKKGERVTDFPEFWEGIYYRFHYIYQAINGGIFDKSGGKNGCEISSRGKSKSLTMASLMAKRFTLGESKEVTKNVKCMATAYQKQYLTSDGILNKFQSYVDFLVLNTEFPAKRLKNSMQDMQWKMGYIDLDTGAQKGSLNEVIGVSAKDDPAKIRGKRLHLIVVEEFGSFKNVLGTYNVMLPSVQEGDISFGTIYLIGTAGDSESDFAGAQEIVYNPKGYNMYPLPNVYDKEGQGRKWITFFFPGYLNRKGCYDENGNSDVTKALLEILENRYRIKYNSSDINSITKAVAEIPITPQEAILRTRGNIFPVTELNERLNEIDNNPNEYNDVYVGNLVMTRDGKVEFVPTTDKPIREFPTKDNQVKGAIEIFEMPQKVGEKIPNGRYIISLDNYENDYSETMSLGSIFVLDLWTDRIVAEYTGRPQFTDDLNEIVRKLCLFYNAKVLYENNKKNTFAYFSKMNCVHLLADTPEYLKQRQLVKTVGYGNTAKGVAATTPIKNFGFELIKNWLLKPVTRIVHQDGEDVEVTVPNLKFIRNRALLKELILFNPDINVDRVMSLVQLMIYRQEKMVLYGGDPQRTKEPPSDYLGNDDFFKNNYDNRLAFN